MAEHSTPQAFLKLKIQTVPQAAKTEICQRGSSPVRVHRLSAGFVPAQASCVEYRLVVRDANTLQVLQLYTCLDQIQYIEWSSDSLFILCAMYKRGIVQVRTKAERAGDWGVVGVGAPERQALGQMLLIVCA